MDRDIKLRNARLELRNTATSCVNRLNTLKDRYEYADLGHWSTVLTIIRKDTHDMMRILMLLENLKDTKPPTDGAA